MKLSWFVNTKLISPIQNFIKDSRSIGIVLLVCTGLSLIISNSSQSHSYDAFWNMKIDISHYLPHSLIHWINDGLMAFFFFLVGMETKRELLYGELASFKKSVLPVIAALGGMIVPALIFLSLNNNTDFSHGWGIPMATDIAFSLGVLSIVGKSIPLSLRIFLTALAIIDDLGAIIVIALFYSSNLQLYSLAACIPCLIILWLLNKYNVRSIFLFVVTAAFLWLFVFNSGIHASIAGVAIAMFVPKDRLNHYEHVFHTPVNFVVLPLFALANTAIAIPDNAIELIGSSLSKGIIGGLVIGKPLGILCFVFVASTIFKIPLPQKTNYKQIAGVSILAGIGFTMSIFIAMLASKIELHQTISKMAVLIASFVSILLGIIWLSLPFVKKNELEEKKIS